MAINKFLFFFRFSCRFDSILIHEFAFRSILLRLLLFVLDISKGVDLAFDIFILGFSMQLYPETSVLCLFYMLTAQKEFERIEIIHGLPI